MTDTSSAAALYDLGRLLLGHASRFRGRHLQDVATRALRDDPDAPGSREWVVRAVNASLRARQRLDYVVRLEPRRLASRLTQPWRASSSAPATRTLSMLCPTRSRVDLVSGFLTSICRTAAAPGRIEVLFYVDDDDPDLAAYEALFARSHWTFGELGRCVLVVGEPVGVPEAWNRLAAAAAGDLLLMANDDQLYVDHGWDAALDARVGHLEALHGDDVMCLYFDDGQYPEGGCDFPILTRSWYDTVGYFTPTIFQQWEVERWLFDIADRLGRLHSVPSVLVEHRHYQDYKAPFDATYQRHRMTREKSFADHALFLRTQRLRESEVERLRVAIRSLRRTGGTSRLAPLPASAASDARRHYTSLIDDLVGAGLVDQAEACADLAVDQGVWRHRQHRPVDFLPDLPVRAEYDADAFWFAAYLAEQHRRLGDDVDRFVVKSELAPEVRRVRLLRDGRWNSEASQFLPVLVDVLSAIPEVMESGVADLEVLPPGTSTPSRCGTTNARLRVAFVLVTSAASGLRVGAVEHAWEAGRCIVFDDGWERRTWNRGPQPVVTVSFHVPHPDLMTSPDKAGE